MDILLTMTRHYFLLWLISILFFLPVKINSTELPNEYDYNNADYLYTDTDEQINDENRRSNNNNINNNINSNININTIDSKPINPTRYIQFGYQNAPPYDADISVNHYNDRNILEKLVVCDIFRENVIYFMGYILRMSSGFLTIDEYISLQLIYNAMKQKRIYLFNLLPVISHLPDKRISIQFVEFMNNIENNVPIYMKSSVVFWNTQFKQNKIDQLIFQIPVVDKQLVISRDLATGITKDHVRALMNFEIEDETQHYDDESEITENLMGQVYVNLFRLLQLNKIQFSQQLFGSILRDLPNENFDPIFEEYLSFIAGEMLTKTIPNWPNYTPQLNIVNPYAAVLSVINKIVGDDLVSLKIRKALLYVRDDLMTRQKSKIHHNNTKVASKINENDLNIDLLFDLTVTCVPNDRVVRAKRHLREYLLSNPQAKSLVGLSRYKYNNPRDFTMAFLAKLQMTLLPNDRKTERIIAILLSNILFQYNYADHQKPKSQPSFWLLIDLINTNEESSTSKSIDFILNTLMKDLYHWNIIEKLIMPSIDRKLQPEKYLLLVLNNLKHTLLNKNIFTLLIKDINILINRVNREFNDHKKHDTLIIKPKRLREQKDYTSNNVKTTKLSVPLIIAPIEKPAVSLIPLKSTTQLNFEPISVIASVTQPIRSAIKQSIPKLLEHKKTFIKKIVPNLSTFTINSIKNNDTREMPSLMKKVLPITAKLITKYTTKKSKTSMKNSAILLNADHRNKFQSKMQLIKSLPPIYSLPKNISTLPPFVEPNKCLIIFTNTNATKFLPPVSTSIDDAENDINDINIFPSMVSLHEQPNDYDIMEHVPLECMRTLKKTVINPLRKIFGKNYAESLLGKNWALRYPTRISAINSLIQSALKTSEVIIQTDVFHDLSSISVTLQMIVPYLFLPMMIRGLNFDGQILWSTVSVADQSVTILGRFSPDKKECGTVTMPIVNPIYWLLPLDNNSDIFRHLLPQLSSDDEFGKELEPLVNIFKVNKIESLLSHKIKIDKFPNKGALFLWTLFKLLDVEEVKLNEPLFNLIKLYWKVIQQPAACIRIPKDIILGEARESHSEWTVDLIGLMKALPEPTDKSQKNMWIIIKKLLSRNNLLDDLNLPLPTVKMSRGKFLSKIFNATLNNKYNDDISRQIILAIQYYKDKIIFNDKHYIGWVWNQIFPATEIFIKNSTTLHIGKLIEDHLPYHKLSITKQRAYNKLVEYFNSHPYHLELDSEIFIDKFKTTGEFIRGLLEYLASKSDIDDKVRRYIYLLIPEVIISGVGKKIMIYTSNINH